MKNYEEFPISTTFDFRQNRSSSLNQPDSRNGVTAMKSQELEYGVYSPKCESTHSFKSAFAQRFGRAQEEPVTFQQSVNSDASKPRKSKKAMISLADLQAK